MTARAMWLHVVLCVLALGLSWRAAHQEKEKKGGPSSVILLDAEKGAVTELTYAWPKGKSVVAVSGGAGRSVVVDVDRELADPKKDAKDAKKDDKKPDGAEAAPDAIAAPPAREVARFPGGKTVVTAIEALEPLKTKRTLGVVDAAQLAPMGLAPPERTLTIKTPKKTLVLELGEASYGAQGRYARVQGESIVHLIDTAIVTGLEGGADTLLEKRLITTELEDITGFSVKAGDKQLAYAHQNRDQPTTRFFAKRDDVQAKDEPAGKLMTTLRNLRGQALFDSAKNEGVLADVVVAVVVDTEAGAVRVDVVARNDGDACVAKVGPWAYDLTATQCKELRDDLEPL